MQSTRGVNRHFWQIRLKVYQRILLSFLLIAFLMLAYLTEMLSTLGYLHKDFSGVIGKSIPLHHHSVDVILKASELQQGIQKIWQLQSLQQIEKMENRLRGQKNKLFEVLDTLNHMGSDIDQVSAVVPKLLTQLKGIIALSEKLLANKHELLTKEALLPKHLSRFTHAVNDVKQNIIFVSESSDTDISTETYFVVENVTQLSAIMNQLSFSISNEAIKTIEPEMLEKFKKLESVIATLNASGELDDDDWESTWDAYQILVSELQKPDHLFHIIQSIAALSQALQTDLKQVTTSTDQFSESIQQLNHSTQSLLVDTSEHIADVLKKNRYVSMVMSVFMLLFLVLIGMRLLRSIKRPLSAFQAHVDQIEKGNLTRHLDLATGDEFEQTANKLNQLTQRLNAVLQKIGCQAIDVEKAVDYVMHSSQELSEVLNKEMGAVDEINDIMSTLSGSSAHVRDNVESTQQRLVEVSDLTTRATQQSHDSSKTMEELKQLLLQTRNQVEKLAKDILDISGMTSLISDIAKKTNLLALNAAIEAARAGEKGAGFAVVADEVRLLANSAQETTNLIRGRIKGIVSESTFSKEVVEKCYSLAEQQVQKDTLCIMTEINAATSEVSSYSMKVCAAAEKQFDHIKTAEGQLDTISQLVHVNAQNFEGISTIVSNLSEMSRRLTEEISYFEYHKSECTSMQTTSVSKGDS